MWPALVVVLVLAAMTGFVDAVAFDRFLGVFPANQSGNAVFLGVAIGGGASSTGWQSGASMVAFALGVVVGELLRHRAPVRRAAASLLACEVVFLVAVVVIAGPIDGVDMIRGFEGYLLIVLTSVAMGVQTTVIRHVAGTAVSSTYVTGAIDRMSAAMSRVVTRQSRLRDEAAVSVLLAVVVLYVAGAALGASPLGEWRWAMGLAAAVVALVSLVLFAAPQRFTNGRE